MTKQNFIPLAIKALFLSVFMMGILTPSHAQFEKWKKKITKRAGDKTEQKVEEKANEKVDQGVDKVIDKIFKKVDDAVSGDSKKDKSSQADSTQTANKGSSPSGKTSEGMDSPGSGDVAKGEPEVTIVPGEIDENVEPSDWIGTFSMRMEEYENDEMVEDYPQNAIYHIDRYKIAIENKQDEGDVIVIFDRQTRMMTTKSIDKEGKKSAFSFKMPPLAVQVEDEDLSDRKYTLRKTGRTKEIAGYVCEQYKIDGEDHVGYVWMSTKMGFDFREMFSWIQIKDNQQGGHVSYDEYFPVDGAVMESTSVEKETNRKNFMTVEYVFEGSVDKGIFSLEGYDHKDMSDILNDSRMKKLEELMKKVEENDRN